MQVTGLTQAGRLTNDGEVPVGARCGVGSDDFASEPVTSGEVDGDGASLSFVCVRDTPLLVVLMGDDRSSVVSTIAVGFVVVVPVAGKV